MRSDLDADDSVEHFEVAVSTPRGTWPVEGFFEVPVEQELAQLLEHAASSLKIEDTDGWIAVADGRKLDPAISCRSNCLTKRVFIYYGLPEMK